MIVVTGAAGFIGSCLIKRLNEENFNAIIAVDEFNHAAKNKNLEGLKIQKQVEREGHRYILAWSVDDVIEALR